LKTVKIKVAELVSKNKVVANHKIMGASAEHPLSGLQRLRELKKEFKESRPDLTAYNFDRTHNLYEFTAGFRLFCGRVAKKSSKREVK